MDLRLGDGTAESHRRMQAAVDALWPYTLELFAAATADRAGAVPPAAARSGSPGGAGARRGDADPPGDGWAPGGGRAGRHTEHLSYLLAEMQVVHRAHPGARW